MAAAVSAGTTDIADIADIAETLTRVAATDNMGVGATIIPVNEGAIKALLLLREGAKEDGEYPSVGTTETPPGL